MYLERELWWDQDGRTYWSSDWPHGAAKPTEVCEVTEDMLEGVLRALEYIQEKHDRSGGILLSEQAVPIGQFTGEAGATGSADVIVLRPPVLAVEDLKMGRHRVYASEVVRPEGPCPITGVIQPEIRRPNLQLACYALGALRLYDLFGEFTHVTLGIVQPMLGHTDEYTMTIAELREVEEYLRQKAEETRTAPVFRPSADACHYCVRSGDCDAQTRMVFDAAVAGFEETKPVTDAGLGSRYAMIPMIRSWCDATEARVRDKLSSGEPVFRDDGLSYKLIEGRATRRTWTDSDAALLHLHSAIGDAAYQPRKVVTPAMAESMTKTKRVKKGVSLPKSEWDALQSFITQGQAKPSIVLETDTNPAIPPATAGFEDISDT